MWKKYDDEFKRNALQKVFDGQSVRSVVEELGVNESLIHKWKRAALTKGDGKQSGTQLSAIEALKKRNRELEMHHLEILKKAELIFGRGSQHATRLLTMRKRIIRFYCYAG